MEARSVEARDGHNWENWRDRLREGLSWLSRARCYWCTSSASTAGEQQLSLVCVRSA